MGLERLGQGSSFGVLSEEFFWSSLEFLWSSCWRRGLISQICQALTLPSPLARFGEGLGRHGEGLERLGQGSSFGVLSEEFFWSSSEFLWSSCWRRGLISQICQALTLPSPLARFGEGLGRSGQAFPSPRQAFPSPRQT